MPTTPSDIPYHLTAGLKTIFFKEYNRQVNDDWRKIVTEVPSTKASETYAWLGSTPAMREWVDERMPASLAEHGFQIDNKKWEASISVSKDALDDDQYGQIRVRVQQLAEASRDFYRVKAFDTIVGGTATECYDGQYFFDNDHSEGSSGTQDNLNTLELTSENLTATRADMMRFKDDKGNVMGISGDILLVPPELEATALEIVGAETIERYTASGTDKQPTLNVHKGRYQVVVTERITDEDSWYLICGNRVTKPVIFQNRQATEFAQLEANSETGFTRDEYLYGVKNRFNMGLGDWRLAYANVPA
jgi:phage major head subunit gpT-like protein